MKSLISLGIAAALAAFATPNPRMDAPRANTTVIGQEGGVALPPPSWNPSDPADSLYKLGRQAIADREYRRAARLFQQIVDDYPKSDYAGDALYWRAYSLMKNAADTRSPKDLELAMESIDRQAEDYADARTRSDARELRQQIRSLQARLGNEPAARELGKTVDELKTSKGCASDDDDVRTAALQGLIQMDAESAIPILKQVLARRDECSESLRKTAVWLIAQKERGDAAKTLLDVARNDPSVDVRRDAIHWLGQTRSEIVIPALDSIITSSRDDEVRNNAIFALSQQNDSRAADILRRVAENEKLPEDVRGQAVWWLGQKSTPTTISYLRQLYSRTESEDIRNNILHVISQSGDSAAGRWLLDIALDKSQPTESRKTALFFASQQRKIDGSALINMYDRVRGDHDMQEHLIWLISQRNDRTGVDKLIEIASNDPDRELRKTAIHWLGQMRDPRAQKFLLDLISK